jgi:hypothetical protein
VVNSMNASMHVYISIYRLCPRVCVGKLREISLESQVKVSNARKGIFTTLSVMGNAKCYLNLEMT